MIAGSVFIVLISLNGFFCEELFDLSCMNARECKQYEQPGVDVFCIEGTCHCFTANRNSTDGTTEKPLKCTPFDHKHNNIVGGPCPCRWPQAECDETQNICYCSKNFVASADKRRCLPEKVALYETCESDAQCDAADHHTVCNPETKTCQCRQNFIWHNGTCISVADPHATCANDQDCLKFGAHVNCFVETKKCTCLDGYVRAYNKSQCLAVASYSEHCSDNQQCQTRLGAGGACINGTCLCSDMYQLLQTKVENEAKNNVTLSICTRIIEIGEYCREDRDCYHHQLPDEDQTMSCIYGECNCKWGYNSINNMECFKSSKATSLSPMMKFITFFILAIMQKRNVNLTKNIP